MKAKEAPDIINQLKLYLGNLLSDPKKPLFKKIIKASSKVLSNPHGVKFLKAIGFEEKAKTFEIKEVNIGLIKSCLELLPI